MANVSSAVLDQQMPPGIENSGASALMAVGGGKKNLIKVRMLPCDGLTGTMAIPVYYVRSAPVYTDFSNDPIGTEIQCYLETNGVIAGYDTYYKVANAAASTDIKKVTVA